MKTIRVYKYRHCRQDGFTLLEVLVALAVAAIGLAAVTKSMTSNVDVTAKLKERTIATWVASNRMAELRMERQFSSSGGGSGRVEMVGITWEVEEEYSATEDPNIAKVDIMVYLSGNRQPSGQLSGYLANYTPASPSS